MSTIKKRRAVSTPIVENKILDLVISVEVRGIPHGYCDVLLQGRRCGLRASYAVAGIFSRPNPESRKGRIFVKHQISSCDRCKEIAREEVRSRATGSMNEYMQSLSQK
ncbi:hypothetical protein A3D62_01345 [Candidatus Kaiserbacteria bacterium RIFCSPHIGHO2_02_FULL_49_11]|uniref:Uncharacterized protein n=1 Tax=Candidatus Kaiserbacteria bacterium RIFCSPHIGHO2_02_FULL_49_11 TaxID=1798489 RepID=A0A1F6D247_9BACT|nr:MAG: hypothetical protein A3D62_01345 [Candidatus Kaiserbacteria bacterium RIFCSPHIGHO2_02_FULL_49_11]